MSALLISYDLNKPGQKYAELHEAIKGLGSAWAHYLESTWMVVTSKSPTQAWDALAPHVDKSDNVLIINITGDSYSGWMPQDAWTWVKQNV